MVEADLEIIEKEVDSIPVLELNGEVDAYNCPKLREAINKALLSNGSMIIVDMSKVEYIDSSGLGTLVGGLKRAKEKDGDILIVCNTSQVKKVFDITGLCNVFLMSQTMEQACALLKSDVSEV